MGNYIHELFANRIGGNRFGKDSQIYKFEKIKKAKREAIETHPELELIDVGVGEPDGMADSDAIDCLHEETRKWKNRGYTDNGIPEFKNAAALYMKSVFHVNNLNPDTDIVHGIGSKSLLAMLPHVFINPGDITITTVPGYPVISTATKALGGDVVNLPLLEKNGFYPDLNMLSSVQLQRAKLLYINYPNNPTGAIATKSFYEDIVSFARRNGIIIVSDEAYSTLVFDDTAPLSLLNISRAKDVSISIQSLSKAFNMTGWRIGFAAGNELLIKALAAVKANHDSGQFAPIQLAAARCLKRPEIIGKNVEKYSRRHDALVTALRRVGFDVKKPKGTFYLYVKIPKATTSGIHFNTAEEFSQYLIREKMISTVPWDDAGAFVRFSVTFFANNEEEELNVINEIERRLGRNAFIF